MEELFMQVFERRDWVKAQMRQHAVSYSQSLACAILAAGRRPPPWLIPALDAVATQGNTLRKPYLDLANPKSEYSLQHVLPETYERVEPKTLEFGGRNPGGLPSINCSGAVDQWQKCVYETVLNEITATHSLNENPPSTSSVEVPHSITSLLSQNDTLQPAKANLQEIPHFVTSPLPEKEITGVSETDSLTGMTCMTRQLLENDSLQSLEPSVIQGPDSVSSPLSRKETMNAAETVSLVEPIDVASPHAENDSLQPKFLEGHVSVPLPEKDARNTTEMGPIIRGLISMAFPQLEDDSLPANILEGSDSLSGLLPEKIALHTAETESAVGLTCTASPQFENDLSQPNLLEGSDSVSTALSEKDAKHTSETDLIEGSCSIDNVLLEKDILHSDEANFPEGPNTISSSLLEKEPTCASDTDFIEEAHYMANPLVENATLHSVDTNFPEGLHSMVNVLLEMETTHTFETTLVEESCCLVTAQPGKDSLYQVEHTETLRKRIIVSDNRIDETSEYFEQQSSECHVLSSPCNESSLRPAHLANTPGEETKMLSMLQENMSGGELGYSLDLEENMFHDNHGRFLHSHLHDTFSVSSLANSAISIEKLLCKSNCDDDVYQSNNISSGTTISDDDPISCNGTEAFVSTQNESAQLLSSLAKPSLDFEMISKAADIHIVSSEVFSSLDFEMISKAADIHIVSSEVFSPNERFQRELVIDSVKCRQEQSDHAQEKMLDQGEASDVYVRNNMNETEMPDGLSSASSKSAGILQTIDRRNTGSSEQPLRSHDGTECQICRFNVAMEINSDSCTTVSDKQIQSARPSSQHLLHSSRCGELVTPFKSDNQSTDSHHRRPFANVIQVQGNSSCERVEMNHQSGYPLYSSCGTPDTSSMDCQDDSIDKMLTRADISGKPQHSVCCTHSSGSGSVECITLSSVGMSNTSTWKNPVSYDAHTSMNSSSQRSMSSPSDAIHCNSPRAESLFCSSNSLSGDLITVPHYSISGCSGMSDGDGQYTRKTNSCFIYHGLDVKSVIVEDRVLIQMDYVASGSAVLNPKTCPSSSSPTTFPSYPSLDMESQHACDSNCSNIELGEKSTDGDPGQPVSDGDIPLQNSDNCAECNESVQEEQSCSIPIPSDSPNIQERVLEAYRDSTKLANLSSNLSAKYKLNSKMESLSGTYQSLAARFAKLLNQSSLTEVDAKWHFPSYDTKMQGISCNQEDNEIPLTPFGKYSLDKLLGRTRNASECMDSIQELPCFRIDEDSSTAEENENNDKPLGSLGGNYSAHGLADRKPFECVPNLHKSKEKSASMSGKYMDVGKLGLSTTKAFCRESDHESCLIFDQGIKNPKENRAPSIRKGNKVTQSLHDRGIKEGILGNQTERHKSEANLVKGWKPRNSVTSMTSFIPPVKQKQQPKKACVVVKRDVRVKALEVAEAAKRREQKKQNEREMRKAAADLERERLKQEREQKQKQVEQKKKMDDIVTRKRQREHDERKERKKKCIEEPRKQQKQLGERMYAGNNGKDGCRKDPSYEMSPYEDSDEDDDGDLEHKREVRRRRKLIPSWARTEILDKILLSNQTLDGREIFERKSSFSLSNVLAPRIPQQRLN